MESRAAKQQRPYSAADLDAALRSEETRTRELKNHQKCTPQASALPGYETGHGGDRGLIRLPRWGRRERAEVRGLPVSDAVVELDLVVRVNRRLRQRQVLTGGKRHRFYPTTPNANNHCAICVSGVVGCFSGVRSIGDISLGGAQPADTPVASGPPATGIDVGSSRGICSRSLSRFGSPSVLSPPAGGRRGPHGVR